VGAWSGTEGRGARSKKPSEGSRFAADAGLMQIEWREGEMWKLVGVAHGSGGGGRGRVEAEVGGRRRCESWREEGIGARMGRSWAERGEARRVFELWASDFMPQ
jgi:hypothetical protein